MTKKINTPHAQYTKLLTRWQKIDRFCDAEDIQQYIRYLNPLDKTDANVKRNDQYRENAVYYNIAGYTARGLVGMVFRKWPKLSVPKELEYINENVDGSGVSIYQQSQNALKSLVRKGRAGLLVDYPKTEGGASKADLEAGRIFATIKRFEPEQIIDWGITSVGARVLLSRVVLSDTVEENGEEIDIILELLLVEGRYATQEWRRKDGKGEWELWEESFPLDANQRPWDEIPFIFLGAETNTHTIDSPPLFDITEITAGHYNNSASYEDSVHWCGQPQPWMSGLTQEQIDLMAANNMYIGSRECLSVPSGEQFGFAQAAPNPIVREAMRDKVEMAIGLGAMFIQPGSAVKTATQAEGEQQVQHSVLSLIASNLSEGYTKALKYMARYMNCSDEVEYTVNQDLVPRQADAQMLQQMVAGWMQGAIPQTDLTKWLQQNNLVDPEKTPEEVAEELGPKPSPLNFDKAGEDE